MNLTTVAARGAAGLVAAVAGAASYEHIASVAKEAGERAWVAYALPGAIDGLIVVGVAALLEDRRNGHVGRLSARLAVVVGVLATLAANVASAEPSLRARLVAVTAPVSFLIAVEVLTRRGRVSATVDNPPEEIVVPDIEEMPGYVEFEPPVESAPKPARPRASRRPANAERVAKALTRTPGATPAEIAAKLKISERTVQRHWPAADVTVTTANGRLPAQTGA